MNSKIVIQNKGTKKISNIEILVKWFIGKFGYVRAKEKLAEQYQVLIYLKVI